MEAREGEYRRPPAHAAELFVNTDVIQPRVIHARESIKALEEAGVPRDQTFGQLPFEEFASLVSEEYALPAEWDEARIRNHLQSLAVGYIAERNITLADAGINHLSPSQRRFIERQRSAAVRFVMNLTERVQPTPPSFLK